MTYCYLPLLLFEGLSGKLITAVLRPGKRPKGKEHSAIIKRVLLLIRQAWADTHIVLRGDGHFANPELMALCETDTKLDFIFGLAGNKAEPLRGVAPPTATLLYGDTGPYPADSCPRPYRVVLKAEARAGVIGMHETQISGVSALRFCH